MTIANQLIFHAKEESITPLKELLNTLAEVTLAESGCQKFELYQRFDDRSYFYITEIWKSEKRYKAHTEDPSFQNMMSEITTLSSSHERHALKLTQCLTKLGLKKGAK